MEGHRRSGQDPGRGPPRLIDRFDQATLRVPGFRRAFQGPWRVAVTEASMAPAVEPGDWLLVDPTTGHWPRRGSVVVFREPDSDELAIKRVAARPGDRVAFSGGYLVMGDDEAWLLADATEAGTLEAGYGPPIDSRRFGPVPLGQLVGRAWFRYAPLRRIGRIRGGRQR
jgi:hypothetical protein